MIDHDNLEEFADPVNYDREDSSTTGIAFYSALAKEAGSPVLEIACGTGRVTIPIAQLGFHVTGLDIVPGMIARARSKSIGLPARWVEADARTCHLGEHFRLIFMTGNAFQAFVTNADQQALLERVHAHLHDEGLFAFETRNPLLPNTRMPAGFFFALETCDEEEQWSSFVNADGYEVRVSTTRRYVPSRKSCIWSATSAGAKASKNTQRSRARRYAIPSPKSLLHCCTTMALPSCGSTAIGRWSR
ncbi:MAG TPA: class I SAM-dependent methyltransferase [Herpetosiphonaceae bacterium]|nr:class I SAM-dependent methyltransferase [Herpetosiphonaceae bacterium]